MSTTVPLDMRQKGILLCLVESVNFIHEERGCPSARRCSAALMISRSSGIPPVTAENGTNCDFVYCATSSARVFFRNPEAPENHGRQSILLNGCRSGRPSSPPHIIPPHQIIEVLRDVLPTAPPAGPDVRGTAKDHFQESWLTSSLLQDDECILYAAPESPQNRSLAIQQPLDSPTGSATNDRATLTSRIPRCFPTPMVSGRVR